MLKPMVLIIAISIGGMLGWHAGAFMGLMAAYLSGVLGSSIGLYLGRRIQRCMGGD